MKKNIVIVGYPKSGTTWISRLVAELVECPLQGDWGFESIEAEYKEGIERISEYDCYKSHHSFNEIGKVSTKPIYKIIYVIRDPRDIVISSFHYFDITYPILKKIFIIPSFYKLLERIINALKNKKSKKRAMIKMVLNGDKTINRWCEISWKKHFDSYSNEDVIFIQYEKMLFDSLNQCTRILKELNIVRTKKHIRKSIKNQEFNYRKKEDNKNKKLLRQGLTNYWKKEFNTNEKEIFAKELKKELLSCEYYLK